MDTSIPRDRHLLSAILVRWRFLFYLVLLLLVVALAWSQRG